MYPLITLYIGASMFVLRLTRLLSYLGRSGKLPFNYSLTNPYSKYVKCLGLYIGTGHNSIIVELIQDEKLLVRLQIINWVSDPMVEIDYIKN